MRDKTQISPVFDMCRHSTTQRDK